MVIYCPVCSGIDVGKVASSQYYCWDCCIEFKMAGNRFTRIYNIEDDGTLTGIDQE